MLFKEYIENIELEIETYIDVLFGNLVTEGIAELDALAEPLSQAKDIATANELVSRMYPFVRKLTFSIFRNQGVTTNGPIDAEAVASDTIIRIRNALVSGKYEPGNVSAWVSTIIARIINNYRKALKIRKRSKEVLDTDMKIDAKRNLRHIAEPEVPEDEDDSKVNWMDVADRISAEIESMINDPDSLTRIKGKMLKYVLGARENRSTMSHFTSQEIDHFSKMASQEKGTASKQIHDYVFTVQGYVIRPNAKPSHQRVKKPFEVTIDKGDPEWEYAEKMDTDPEAKNKLEQMLLKRYEKLENPQVLWDQTRKDSFTYAVLKMLADRSIKELKEKMGIYAKVA